MLIVVSPAKSLDYESPLVTRKHSMPAMLDEAAQLVEVMAPKSPSEISSLMGISAALGELNHERFQDWELPFTRRTARPAVLAFNGDVYQGMDAASFSERDFTHAQKTLRILSGLYGVLRPLDLMAPYRLEMGTKLHTARGADLYAFWGDKITDRLNEDIAASPGAPVLVNLASNEYFGAVQPKRLEARLVTPKFLDSDAAGNERVVSFFAKRARGVMSAWIIKERIKSVRSLNDFDAMGYRYCVERSGPDAPVFVR